MLFIYITCSRLVVSTLYIFIFLLPACSLAQFLLLCNNKTYTVLFISCWSLSLFFFLLLYAFKPLSPPPLLHQHSPSRGAAERNNKELTSISADVCAISLRAL